MARGDPDGKPDFPQPADDAPPEKAGAAEHGYPLNGGHLRPAEAIIKASFCLSLVL
jgi:hypothetical protein